jgi:hypothetical protein
MPTIGTRQVCEQTTTTLYDLIAAVQSVVEPDNDEEVVATVLHMLRTKRARWCDNVAA